MPLLLSHRSLVIASVSSWLLLVLLATPSSAICPLKVSNACRCSTIASGLQVSCTSIDYDDLVTSLLQFKTSINNLVITRSVIPRITANSFGQLVVQKLSIDGCNVSKIDPDAFDGQKARLQELTLRNNKLTGVPPLSGFKQLHVLDLSGNQISDVGDDAFDGVPELQSLLMARNRICQLGRGALKETKNTLQLLDLAQNCFTAVPAQNLRGFQHLANLDLSRNLLTEIQNLQFMNLPALRELHLEGNRLAQIWPLAFMNVASLQNLYLQENALTFLEPNKFQSLESLEILNISQNHISRIPTSAFRDLQSLKQLIIDRNDIDSVDTLAFSNLPRLSLLSLQANKMVQLSRNAFDQLPQLLILLLNDNALSLIEQGMLAGISSLQQLNLRHNVITNLSIDAFEPVRQLTTLDLSQNQLRDLPQGIFSRLTHLFWLDLSENRLTVLARRDFPPRVANILLQGNAFQCDEQYFKLFVDYLTTNNIRTFLPGQADVVCGGASGGGPETKLKDLMIQRANETFFKSLSQGGPARSGGIPSTDLAGSALTGLFPGLSGLGGDITNLLPGLAPSLGNLVPGLSGAGQSAGGGGLPSLQNIPQPLIQHVLNGGQIPGVSPEALQKLVQSYLQQAAAGLVTTTFASFTPPASAISAVPAQVVLNPVLPPLEKIPPSLLQAAIRGDRIPGITSEQQDQLMKYYREQLLRAPPSPSSPLADPSKQAPPAGTASMPNLYDIPPDVLRDIAAGRTPDISKIPTKVLVMMEQNPYLLAQLQRTMRGSKLDSDGVPVAPPSQAISLNVRSATRSSEGAGNAVAPTVEPGSAKSGMVPGAGVISTIVLSTVGVLTLATVVVLCYQRHQNERTRLMAATPDDLLDQKKLFFGGTPPIATVYAPNSSGSGESILQPSRYDVIRGDPPTPPARTDFAFLGETRRAML